MTTTKPSPQARWWAFRAKLPRLSRLQQAALIIGSLLAFLSFALFILPYLLPLSGEIIPPQNLADPNGLFIDLDGEELYYLSAGERNAGEAVLLLHGFGGSSVDWRETLNSLSAAGYQAYAVDLLGLGLSEKSLDHDLSHPAQAARLFAFLDAHQITAAHIVGHDMGGNIALHMAQSQPERVQSLVLVAPALQYSATASLPTKLLELGFIQRWGRVLIRWILPASSEINLYSAANLDEAITPQLIADYGRAYQTPNWDLAIMALARDVNHNALPAPLETLSTPVLLIWGAADRWIAPAEGEKLAEQIPNARLILLEEVGHLPMHESPQAFNAALLDFWREFD